MQCKLKAATEKHTYTKRYEKSPAPTSLAGQTVTSIPGQLLPVQSTKYCCQPKLAMSSMFSSAFMLSWCFSVAENVKMKKLRLTGTRGWTLRTTVIITLLHTSIFIKPSSTNVSLF